MITGYIIEKCEDGSDKWLRCNARLCPDLSYRVCSQPEESAFILIQPVTFFFLVWIVLLFSSGVWTKTWSEVPLQSLR